MTLRPPKTKFYFWADAIRVLAIFCVVLAHSLGISLTNPKSVWDIASVAFYATPARISVPLLVMLSGALLLGKQESYTLFFKKRLQRILLPWSFWTIVYFFAFILLEHRTYSSPINMIHGLYVLFFSSFWFLPMLAGLYLLTPLLRIWVQHAKRFDLWYAVGLWWVVFSLFPFLATVFKGVNTIDHWYVFEHLGYFLLGYMVVQGYFSKMNMRRLVAFFLLSFASLSIGMFLPHAHFIPNVNYFEYNVSLLAIPATLSTFLLFYRFFSTRNYIPSSVKTTIHAISEVSLGIIFVEDLLRRLLKSGLLGFHLATIPLPYPLLLPLQAAMVFFLGAALLKVLKWMKLGRLVY